MDNSSSESPKLALFSFPSKRKEPTPLPPGILTPPVHTVASVPFQWEEVPGKPRPGCTESKPSSAAARCLELPPRLVSSNHHHQHPQVKVNHSSNNNNNGSSPTTVLEGPYVARSLSHALSLRKGGSFRSPGEVWGKEGSSSRERVLFGSSRWVNSTTPSSSTTVKKNEKVVGGTSDFFAFTDDTGGGSGGDTKVKITRFRKRLGSFRSFSHSSSHLWTSVYESFKQVVPWRRSSSSSSRRSQEKLR